jgi:hypothetical protein
MQRNIMPLIAPIRTLLLALALLLPAAAARAQAVHVLEARPGQAFRMLVEAPAEPAAVVVLLPGGSGQLRLSADGRLGRAEASPALRIRPFLLRAGLAVAAPDLAPDLAAAKPDYRWGEAQARDLGAAIARLRRAGLPVVLLGEGRGALSAANAAVRLAGAERPDGIVLLGGLLMDEGGEASIQRNIPGIARLRLPVLLLHHAEDACRVTPASAPERFRPLLAAAPSVEIRKFWGGTPPRGAACDATAAHGLPGLDPLLAREVAAWTARLPGEVMASR